MVTFSSLWLPILVSAVLVFIASSLIHMVVRWHNSDYKKLPNEEELRAVLRNAAPAQYIVPHCLEGQDMRAPEFQKKFEEGPLAVVYVRPHGPIRLGPFLGRWFLYCIVVSALVAYLARVVLAPTADFLAVLRVVGTTAWLAYAWQAPAVSIWKGKPWAVTYKELVDGLVYGVATGAAFGWLWPR